MKHLILLLVTTFAAILSFAIPPITGNTLICAGSTTILSDATPGGVWISDNTAVATVSATGVVYGVTAGSANISYTVSLSSVAAAVTVTSCGGLPPIIGPSSVCVGSTSVFSDATPGGVWSVSSPVATVSGTGVVYGVTSGTTILYYSVGGSTIGITITISSCSGGITPITGITTVCTGATTILSDGVGGGVWTSSNTAVATVSSSGAVHGVTAGTTNISYTVSLSSVGTAVTVSSCVAIPPITGTTSVCVGATTALSDATPGGTWISTNASVATVSMTGVVYGVSSGTADITYFVSGSSVYVTVTVSSCSGISPITGNPNICVGATAALSDLTPGGVWSSSNTSVATVSATGMVYSLSTGTTIISYMVSGSSVSITVTVSTVTTAGTISGPSIVNAGATATLNETVSGGTWSSSNPAVATINPSTGVYGGVSVGTSDITYVVSGCTGMAAAVYSVTVTAINGISGHVNFSGAPYYGNVKVWLITYNPSTLDLQAIDSSSAICAGSSIYYQFTGIATDSYRVKAAVYDTPGVLAAYIPTYHTSSFYWNTANVIYHTSGIGDINEDINMLSGSPVTGPGFIAGNVTSGANKGTLTGIPVEGMSIYVFNSATNTLIRSTTTDANGDYSFSSLPAGTYYVFPDSLNYITTPYTSIILTTGSATMSAANFVQHTVLKTITPATESVNNLNSAVSSVCIFPNPAHDRLTIACTDKIISVLITDLIGRAVYTHEDNSEQVDINIATLPKGIYLVKVSDAKGLTTTKRFVKD